MIDREQLLEEFLGSIDAPVVVDGRKDREALQALGIEEIVELNRGVSLLEVVESLQGSSRVILLTDLDREGKILRKKLLRLMGPYGISENKRPREILAQMRVSNIEGLRCMLD
ncbi:MAG: hypothetical protein V1703_03570 [Candidatus Altiarchaeota archaeon]